MQSTERTEYYVTYIMRAFGQQQLRHLHASQAHSLTSPGPNNSLALPSHQELQAAEAPFCFTTALATLRKLRAQLPATLCALCVLQMLRTRIL